MSPEPRACEDCLARPWLLARLGGHLDCVRGRIQPLLTLSNEHLVAAVGGGAAAKAAAELASFDADRARGAADANGLDLVCRCDAAYPALLRDLGAAAPAVLHVAGGINRFLELCGHDPVAVVGSRRASSYGLEVAHALGRGLGGAGVPVISGMATGIDAAAHAGALSAGAATIAVLAGSADRPYPAGKRALHRAILAGGAAVSELGPGAEVRRWAFPARNRLIAALSAMTVVVEAGERSGSLITAELAGELQRPVGAVPGRISSPQAVGPNQLLATGARVIRGVHDVLDALASAGFTAAQHPRGPLSADPRGPLSADPRWPLSADLREPSLSVDLRAPLSADLRKLLQAIADGDDTVAALARGDAPPERVLVALAALELGGYLRRTSGGRYSVIL